VNDLLNDSVPSAVFEQVSQCLLGRAGPAPCARRVVNLERFALPEDFFRRAQARLRSQTGLIRPPLSYAAASRKLRFHARPDTKAYPHCSDIEALASTASVHHWHTL
jgi:hypothetical protein